MPKVKVDLGYKIRHCFTYHPWLKIISLILAVITWFYINGAIGMFK